LCAITVLPGHVGVTAGIIAHQYSAEAGRPACRGQLCHSRGQLFADRRGSGLAVQDGRSHRALILPDARHQGAPEAGQPVCRSGTGRLRAAEHSGRPATARSVVEVPYAGEVQRHAGGLCSRDYLVIPDRAAWLGDRSHAGLGQDLQAIGKREERVAGGD